MIQVSAKIGNQTFRVTVEYVGRATDALMYVCYCKVETPDGLIEFPISFSGLWARIRQVERTIPADKPGAFKQELETMATDAAKDAMSKGARPSAITITSDGIHVVSAIQSRY